MSDPISDMLTRIRNAQSSNKNSVSIPSSSLKMSIAEVLKKEGYIDDFEVNDDQVKKYIVIGLKYHEGVPVIESIERGSRPGLRLYKVKALRKCFYTDHNWSDCRFYCSNNGCRWSIYFSSSNDLYYWYAY